MQVQEQLLAYREHLFCMVYRNASLVRIHFRLTTRCDTYCRFSVGSINYPREHHDTDQLQPQLKDFHSEETGKLIRFSQLCRETYDQRPSKLEKYSTHFFLIVLTFICSSISFDFSSAFRRTESGNFESRATLSLYHI